MSTIDYNRLNPSIKLRELENLKAKEGKTGPLSALITKVSNFLTSNSYTGSLLFSRRTTEALRTQEHLLESGSMARHHQKPFLNILREGNSPGFKKLDKEISRLTTPSSPLSFKEKVKYLKENPASIFEIRNRFTEQQKYLQFKLQNLQKGDSLWIDAGSENLQHAMFMRITKNNDGSFRLEYANTGFGIAPPNDDFHASAQMGPNKKKIYQTVGVIRHIPADKLLKGNFFSTFFYIAENGKEPPEKFSSELAHRETENPGNVDPDRAKINLLYASLRGLGSPSYMSPRSKEGSKYWSRSQIGSSCVPSGMWALAKVVLSPEEYKELKTDARMKSLLRNYKKVKEGVDRSSTRKLLVLDQVQKLQRSYEKRGAEAPKVFAAITNEIMSEMQMISPEMKVRSNKTIQSLINPSGQLQPLKAELKSSDRTLVFSSSFKKSKELTESYSVAPRSDGKYQGEDLFDSTYLLYFHIANGDQKSADFYLNQVLEQMKDPAVDSANYAKGMQTVKLLSSLADSLISRDHTRAGIAKARFLNGLAMKQYKLLQKNGKPDAEIHQNLVNLQKRIKLEYQSLNVGEYLPNNMWINGLDRLK